MARDSKSETMDMIVGMFGLIADEFKKSKVSGVEAVKREADIAKKKAMRMYKIKQLGEAAAETCEVDMKIYEEIKTLEREIDELEEKPAE